MCVNWICHRVPSCLSHFITLHSLPNAWYKPLCPSSSWPNIWLKWSHSLLRLIHANYSCAAPPPSTPSIVWCAALRRKQQLLTLSDKLSALHLTPSSCFCRMSGKLCLIFGVLLSHRTLYGQNIHWKCVFCTNVIHIIPQEQKNTNISKSYSERVFEYYSKI